MVEQEVKRIGVASLAKIYAVLSVVMVGIFGWPFLLFEAALPGSGIVSFLILLLFAAIGGIVAGAVSALVYNLVATPLGGVVLDLEPV